MKCAIAALAAALALAAAPAWPAALRATLLLEHGERSPWNDMLTTGLEKAAAKYGISAAVAVAPPGPGQAAIFRQAAESSDIVLVASEGLHEVLRDEAGNFRRKMFGCIDTGIRAKNIMSISFADEQAAFLAGACAAMLAPGSPLGWLMGADTPIMRNMVNGFTEGARLVSPGARIITADCGSFADGAAAARKARQLIGQGCGVVVLAAGAASDAARKALSGSPCLIIGLDRRNGRDTAAIYKKADQAVEDILRAAATGRFRGSSIENRGLASGEVGLDGPAENPASPAAARRLAELARELENGGIRVKSLRRRTLCDDSCFR